MSEMPVSRISEMRAFQAAVRSLSERRSEDKDLPRSLDEGLLKRLLSESFLLQFEDDQSILERRVMEILEEYATSSGAKEARS